MKYALTREDGVTELREDNHPLQDGAIQLSNAEYEQLLSGLYIVENGAIVVNPNPPKYI